MNIRKVSMILLSIAAATSLNNVAHSAPTLYAVQD
jgi:hypothetical protein